MPAYSDPKDPRIERLFEHKGKVDSAGNPTLLAEIATKVARGMDVILKVRTQLKAADSERQTVRRDAFAQTLDEAMTRAARAGLGAGSALREEVEERRKVLEEMDDRLYEPELAWRGRGPAQISEPIKWKSCGSSLSSTESRCDASWTALPSDRPAAGIVESWAAQARPAGSHADEARSPASPSYAISGTAAPLIRPPPLSFRRASFASSRE